MNILVADHFAQAANPNHRHISILLKCSLLDPVDSDRAQKLVSWLMEVGGDQLRIDVSPDGKKLQLWSDEA